MANIELVYVSKAVNRMGQEELTELLRLARAFNEQHQITGLLLYDGYGTFIQALEGDESDVEALYEKILQDKRHSNITRIGRHYIDERSFPAWQMGFRTFDTADIADAEGGRSLFSDWAEGKNITDDSISFAYKMLHHFAAEC